MDRHPAATRTVGLWLLASCLVAVGCHGGQSSAGTVRVDVADVAPDVPEEVETVASPECDPAADPTGCEDGAVCWFETCVVFERWAVEGVEERTVVGTVSSAPAAVGGVADLAGPIVAFHTRQEVQNDAGSREDSLWIVVQDGKSGSAPMLVERWPVEWRTDVRTPTQPPGPVLQVVRGSGGEVAVVRGPNPVKAYTWAGGTWKASTELATGAKLHGQEGDLAAVFGSDGRLNVAYHDLGIVFDLVVATLGWETGGRDDDWTVTRLGDKEDFGDIEDWGARVAGATVNGHAVFAYVGWGDLLKPDMVRGAYVVDETSDGWSAATPALDEGLTIAGKVLGFAATSDDEGRLVLAWVNQRSKLGVAVRQTTGTWDQVDSEPSLIDISEEIPRNLAIGRWRDALLLTWLGLPTRECDCLDLRIAGLRGRRWVEHRLERFAGLDARALALSVGSDGRLVLPVGGGAFVFSSATGGLAAPFGYTAAGAEEGAP